MVDSMANFNGSTIVVSRVHTLGSIYGYVIINNLIRLRPSYCFGHYFDANQCYNGDPWANLLHGVVLLKKVEKYPGTWQVGTGRHEHLFLYSREVPGRLVARWTVLGDETAFHGLC